MTNRDVAPTVVGLRHRHIAYCQRHGHSKLLLETWIATQWVDIFVKNAEKLVTVVTAASTLPSFGHQFFRSSSMTFNCHNVYWPV